MDDEGEGERHTFNSWKYCHYLEFVSVKDAKNVAVRCKLSAKNTTSHLLKHLLWQHSNVKLVERNTGTDREASTASDAGTPAKQQELDFRPGHGGGGTLSGQELKKLVAGYIVEEMTLMSDVEKYLTSSAKAVYRGCIATCTALWTNQVDLQLHQNILVTSSTRWNSTKAKVIQ